MCNINTILYILLYLIIFSSALPFLREIFQKKDFLMADCTREEYRRKISP
jgi:hypothetical protein